jgi:hypothetical protein
MKDLFIEICQLHRDGLAPADIADRLKIPLQYVFDALEMKNEKKSHC